MIGMYALCHPKLLSALCLFVVGWVMQLFLENQQLCYRSNEGTTSNPLKPPDLDQC